MAKRQGPPSGAKQRKTDDQVRQDGFTPFLRPEHTKNGAHFNVTGWNTAHKDGKQYIVEVQDEAGELYSMGVRIGSPDHRILQKALGADWANWKGGLSVQIRKGNQGDVSFVNVATADKAQPFDHD
jgi:hypothetical protein